MKHLLPGVPPARRLSSTFCLFLLFALLPSTVRAVFVAYDNCLPSYLNTTAGNDPRRVQFIPLFVDAKFNTSDPNYSLSLRFYGNVTGQQFAGPYPNSSDPDWRNPEKPFGKITNVGTANTYSTITINTQVLSYEAWQPPNARFCEYVINGQCPLAPAFNVTVAELDQLPAFGVQHDFLSSYSFATLNPTIRVLSGDTQAPDISCISASITPDLGSAISALLTWLPAAILILKGIATLVAAIWSPWGSSDIFRWSSNYGRDEDLLRLVTPGFGDCLQYIQFVALTGALTLQYPGFYQPAVSKTAWSLLLFNESYVSKGPGTQSLIDGIYVTRGAYGMTRLSELVGMSEPEDLWACMAIWLLVIAAIVAVLCQIGFFGRWCYRAATGTKEGDLRKKNLPFTLGNMTRLMFNFFILPVVALSLYQFVIATSSPVVVVAMAAVLLAIVVAAAVWILSVIIQTKPRTYLFDDMPTVLLYGPLYNTYSDSAAPFAFIPVVITAIRGLALGVLQPSGIAQLIVLAICEVILILTLNGFRPFQGQTSMNLYHTSFAVVRLITVFLCIAFLPSLGVSEAPKGWIGYVILFLHACVLVFGFFLNSAQTLIEVIARACGVGSDAQSGAIRGGIFNLRMLRKRQDRPKTADRASAMSNGALLSHADQTSAYGGAYEVRSRSMSASSQQLLNRAHTNQTPSTHRMSGFENFSSSGDPTGPSPSFEQEASAGAYTTLPLGDERRPTLAVKTDTGPFYRPPRARKATIDTLSTPTSKTKGDLSSPHHATHPSLDAGFVPVHMRERAESNENLTRPDYAVREVDLFYRGPALNDQPTRKLKTGPADPEGPVVQAQSWFQRLMFGMKQQKKKEPSKGFEVVRSSRLSPEMQAVQHDEVEMEDSPPMRAEPYRDAPNPSQHAPKPSNVSSLPSRIDTQAAAGAERDRSTSPVSPISPAGPIEEDQPSKQPRVEGFDFGFGQGGPHTADLHMHPGMRAEQPGRPRPSVDVVSVREQERDFRVSSQAPALGPVDIGGDLDLPSRFNSRRSAQISDIDIAETAGGQNWLQAVDNLLWNHGNAVSREPSTRVTEVEVPRRSSRRAGSDNQFGTLLTPTHARPSDGEVRHGSYHHRAQDSITRNSFGASEASQGQIAEIFGRTPPGDEHMNSADRTHGNS